MLSQGWIKPFWVGKWMLTVAVWSDRDLLSCLRWRLPNLPVCVPVSAAWAVYYPGCALLSVMSLCCWLSRAHREDIFLSLKGNLKELHSLGVFGSSLRPQYNSKTSHRVRRSGVLCVWLVEVCLPGSDQCSRLLQENREEKPEADFWGCIHWWKYVLGCCWTGVDCSLHTLVGYQLPNKNYGPPRVPIAA